MGGSLACAVLLAIPVLGAANRRAGQRPSLARIAPSPRMRGWRATGRAPASSPTCRRRSMSTCLRARRSLSRHRRSARGELSNAGRARHREAGPDHRLSLRPVRAGQIAHRHRCERPVPGRQGLRARRAPRPAGAPRRRSRRHRPRRRSSPSSARRESPAGTSQRRSAGCRAARPPDAKPVIVLDPGHGGIDPGTSSADGITEKEVVLAFAKTLKQKLEADGPLRGLSDPRGRHLPAAPRARRVRAKQGRESVRVDPRRFFPQADRRRRRARRSIRLSEQASDDEAKELAAKENFSDAIAGVALPSDSDEVVANILIDLAQRETQNRSTGLREIDCRGVGAADCTARL